MESGVEEGDILSFRKLFESSTDERESRSVVSVVFWQSLAACVIGNEIGEMRVDPVLPYRHAELNGLLTAERDQSVPPSNPDSLRPAGPAPHSPRRAQSYGRRRRYPRRC